MTKTEAIEYFGTQQAIADVLDIDQSSISLWGQSIPLPRQAQLQILSDGKLRATLPSPRKRTRGKRRR